MSYSDNISTAHGNPDYCDKTVTITTGQPYFSVTLNPLTAVAYSTLLADTGNRSVSITVALVDKPSLTKSVSFFINMQDPCKTVVLDVDPAPLLPTDLYLNMPTTTVLSEEFKSRVTQWHPAIGIFMPWCAL